LIMDHTAYLDLEQFNDEARRELKTFIEFLTFKYGTKQKIGEFSKFRQKQFKALKLDTTQFKFNREEANER
jgi:hypothetical protein